MPNKLTDAELAARCTCGVPIDVPDGHHLPCPVAQRVYNQRRRPRDNTPTPAARVGPERPARGAEKARRATARTIAGQLAAARVYLAAGGRPRCDYGD